MIISNTQSSQSTEEILSLNEIFPFEYVGGGYYRRKGIPKGQVAEILHGMQAIEYLFNQIKQRNKSNDNPPERID